MATNPTAPQAPAHRGSDWLESWTPEDPETWDSGRAWKTLWVTTFSLTLAFITWFLVSALAPVLNNIGFDLSTSQLYWLTAMPGLAGGSLRLVWMFLPPVLGTRKMVFYSTLLLLLPLLGWGVAVQNPNTSFAVLLLLAILAGIGGGVFSGFMPSTSYFFPKAKQGTALGVQAGVGNFGVSIVQFTTPWIIGFALIGGTQVFIDPDKNITKDVWYQNAAWIWVPFVVVAAIMAWTMLRSVPIQVRGIRQQLDIFNNKNTWIMTLLYIITFGTFSGLAASFGLLIKQYYGSRRLRRRRHIPGPVRLLGRPGRLGRPRARRTDRRPGRRRRGHPRGSARRGRRRGLHVLPARAHLGARLPRVLLGDAGDLLLRRRRQRLDVQADADDLRAPAGRRRDRLDRCDRRVRALRVRPDVRHRVHRGAVLARRGREPRSVRRSAGTSTPDRERRSPS